jgi:osmotically-inducible protein OsmY
VRNALIREPALKLCTIRAREPGGVSLAREAARESAGVIEAAVADGVVTLDGQVPSLSRKRLAGVLAWWVPGSRDVINGLEVAPPQEDSDEELTGAVRLVLDTDPLVNADQIRVHTRNAVVTLEGLVASDQEKALADSGAWYVFGVEKVVTTLAIQEQRDRDQGSRRAKEMAENLQ